MRCAEVGSRFDSDHHITDCGGAFVAPFVPGIRGRKQSTPQLCGADVLRVTPAMAMGITDHIWSIGELVDVATAEPVELAA